MRQPLVKNSTKYHKIMHEYQFYKFKGVLSIDFKDEKRMKSIFHLCLVLSFHFSNSKTVMESNFLNILQN